MHMAMVPEQAGRQQAPSPPKEAPQQGQGDTDTGGGSSLAATAASHIANAADPGVARFVKLWDVNPPLLMLPFLDTRHAVQGYAPLGLSMFNAQDALASMVDRRGWRVDRMESVRHGVKVKATHTFTSGGLIAVPPRTPSCNDRNLFMAAYAMNAQRGVDLFVNELLPDERFRMYADLDFHNLSVMSPRQVLQVARTAQRAVQAFFRGPPRDSSGRPLPPAMPPVASQADREALRGSWGVLCVLSTQYKRLKRASPNAPQLYGTGIHLVWPDLVVTLPQALLLRKAIKQALRQEFGRRSAPLNSWGDVVDRGVYKNGLRMPCSYKVEPCPGEVHRSGGGGGGAAAALDTGHAESGGSTEAAAKPAPLSLGEALRRARQQQQQSSSSPPPPSATATATATATALVPGSSSAGAGRGQAGGKPAASVAPEMRAYLDAESMCPYHCTNGRVNGGRAYWPICVLSRAGERDLAYEDAFRRSLLFMLEQCVVQTEQPLTPGFLVPTHIRIPAYIKPSPEDLKLHLERRRAQSLSGGAAAEEAGMPPPPQPYHTDVAMHPATWTVDAARAFRPSKGGRKQSERTRALRRAAGGDAEASRAVVLQPMEQVLQAARTRRELREASHGLRARRQQKPLRTRERAALAAAELPADVDGEGLETAVEAFIRSPEAFPQHRHWRNLRVRQLLYDAARHRILVDVASDRDDGERYCMNKGTTHNSRLIFFEISAEGLSQRCFSKHKHRGQLCSRYRSAPVPLPAGGLLEAVLQPLLNPHYAARRRQRLAPDFSHASLQYASRAAVAGEGSLVLRQLAGRGTGGADGRSGGGATPDRLASKLAALQESLNLTYDRLHLPRQSAVTQLLPHPEQRPVEMLLPGHGGGASDAHGGNAATLLRVDETRLGRNADGMESWLGPGPGQRQGQRPQAAASREAAHGTKAGPAAAPKPHKRKAAGEAPDLHAALDAAGSLDAWCSVSLPSAGSHTPSPVRAMAEQGDAEMAEAKDASPETADPAAAPSHAADVDVDVAVDMDEDDLDAAVLAALHAYITHITAPELGQSEVRAVLQQVPDNAQQALRVLEVLAANRGGGGTLHSSSGAAWRDNVLLQEGFMTLGGEAGTGPASPAASASGTAAASSPGTTTSGGWESGREAAWSDTDSLSSFASFPVMPLPGQVRHYHRLHALPLAPADAPLASQLLEALRARWACATRTLTRDEVDALQRARLHYKPVLRALWRKLGDMLRQRYSGGRAAGGGSGPHGRWSRSKMLDMLSEYLQASVLEPWFSPNLASDGAAFPPTASAAAAARKSDGGAGIPVQGSARDFLQRLALQ